MSMTYLEIQNAVIDSVFDETDRGFVQQWIQSRHAWLWDLEDWVFKQATDTVTFTSNTQTVASVPSDLGIVLALYGGDGAELKGYPHPSEFYSRYNTNLAPTGSPEAFTVLNGVILVGPMGDGTSGILLYERRKPSLSDDADRTDLPDGYDQALVFGAKAEGCKARPNTLAAEMDDNFTAAVNAMRAQYLTTIRGAKMQMGAYRAGTGSSWR